jgi:hypothetical protein
LCQLSSLEFSEKPVMCRIKVKQLDYELTPVSGLALLGHYLKAQAPQRRALDGALLVRRGGAAATCFAAIWVCCRNARDTSTGLDPSKPSSDASVAQKIPIECSLNP